MRAKMRRWRGRITFTGVLAVAAIVLALVTYYNPRQHVAETRDDVVEVSSTEIVVRGYYVEPVPAIVVCEWGLTSGGPYDYATECPLVFLDPGPFEFVLDGLTPGVTYYYRVFSMDLNETYAFSDERVLTTSTE